MYYCISSVCILYSDPLLYSILKFLLEILWTDFYKKYGEWINHIQKKNKTKPTIPHRFCCLKQVGPYPNFPEHETSQTRGLGEPDSTSDHNLHKIQCTQNCRWEASVCLSTFTLRNYSNTVIFWEDEEALSKKR